MIQTHSTTLADLRQVDVGWFLVDGISDNNLKKSIGIVLSAYNTTVNMTMDTC